MRSAKRWKSRRTSPDPYSQPFSVFSLKKRSKVEIVSCGLGAGHADHHRGAALADHVVRLERGLGETDDLERVVDAATAGELLHLRDRVALVGVDEVGGAERLGELALHLDRVDRDDRDAPAMRAALDHRLADAAAADDRHGRAGVHARAVLSAAPTPVVTPQPMSASWSSVTLVFDLDDRRLVARHRLGERAEAGHGRVVGAVGALAAVTAPYLELGVAQVRLVVQAEPADAARGDERGARRGRPWRGRYFLADLDDRARALVAEDRAGHDAERSRS